MKVRDYVISVIDIENKEMAREVLNVQIPAYEVEAELIQFDGIPQLFDTVELLASCGESFLGFFSEGVLQGVLSYCKNEDEWEICRLVVHPACFKKGIATALLEFFLQEVVGKGELVKVNTGAANIPAITIYKKFGFSEIDHLEVAPGVQIIEMQQIKA